MKHIAVFFFICFSFIASLHATTPNPIIHGLYADGFQFIGFEIPCDKKKVPFSVELGRFLIIKSHKTEGLPGKSSQAIFELEDEETGKFYTCTSRIINNEPFSIILAAVEERREVQSKKHGWFEGIVEYSITLEDGAQYTVKYSTGIMARKETDAQLNEIFIEPGELFSLGNSLGTWAEKTAEIKRRFAVNILAAPGQLKFEAEALGMERKSHPYQGRKDNKFLVMKTGIGSKTGIIYREYQTFSLDYFGHSKTYDGLEYFGNNTTKIKEGEYLTFEHVNKHPQSRYYVFRTATGVEVMTAQQLQW